MLYPDVFAGFTGWVPFTGNDTNGTPAEGTVDVTAGAVGNMRDFVGNVRHVPGSMLFGVQDELVQVPSAEEMRKQFLAGDSSFRWWQHSAADHFVLAVADDWRKEAAYSEGQRRVSDPGRVTYRTATFLDSPEHGVRHDRAYWVSGVRPRGTGYADTDLTSAGCGAPVLTKSQALGAGPDPVPYVQDGQDAAYTRGPRAARLTGTLAGVAALTVDVRRACLPGAFTYAITSDGPAVLTLSDGRVLRLAAGANEGTLAGQGSYGGRVTASSCGSSPTAPSACSRSRSRCPRCRPVSSTRCSRTQRRLNPRSALTSSRLRARTTSSPRCASSR